MDTSRPVSMLPRPAFSFERGAANPDSASVGSNPAPPANLFNRLSQSNSAGRSVGLSPGYHQDPSFEARVGGGVQGMPPLCGGPRPSGRNAVFPSAPAPGMPSQCYAGLADQVQPDALKRIGGDLARAVNVGKRMARWNTAAKRTGDESQSDSRRLRLPSARDPIGRSVVPMATPGFAPWRSSTMVERIG
jgi:hypothetical protein